MPLPGNFVVSAKLYKVIYTNSFWDIGEIFSEVFQGMFWGVLEFRIA